MIFPKVTAFNLRGQRFSLPSDFGGKFNILLMPFSMEQQIPVNSWIPFIEKIERTYPEVQYYELPVVQEFEPARQRMIDGWMQAGIPDLRVQQKTITLYLDIAAWRKALMLPTRENYTFLVDHQGNILWRRPGWYTTEKGQSLHEELAKLP